MKMNTGMGDLVVRVLLILVLVFGLAPPATAQSTTAQTQTARTEPAQGKSSPGTASAHVAAKPSGATQEGIKVHGHWVIEVRNPDGTLAVRREIQNALDFVGPIQLAALLSRNASMGRWAILLSGNPSPCGPGVNDVCQIAESGAVGANVFPTLTVTVGGASDQVVLSGIATANRDGQVSLVLSRMGTCTSDTAPLLCNAFVSPFANGSFSRRFLGSPGAPPVVPVVSGQIIQVTVTFSFS